MNTTPFLELILGPMYSGKTSEIIKLHRQYTFCNIPVVVINHVSDTRYHDTLLASHDRHMIECIQTDALNKARDTALTAHAILINEGQFFPDLYTFVTDMLDAGKRIHIASLNGDFLRKPIGQTLDLVPLADEIHKLHAICSVCKKVNGIFSKRITCEKEQIVIGSDNYIPVCRGCW